MRGMRRRLASVLGTLVWCCLRAADADVVRVCDAEPPLESQGTCYLAHNLQLQQGSGLYGANLPLPNIDLADKRPKVRQKGGTSRSRSRKDKHAEDTNPWARAAPHENLTCGASGFAPFSVDCPEGCDILTPDPAKGCHWICGKQCNHPEFNVLDEYSGICRKCEVAGCGKCAFGEDKCEVCEPYYRMTPDGCKSIFRFVWWTLEVIIVIIILILAVWYVYQLCSPKINEEGLAEALAFRKQMIPHGEDGKPIPLGTDLRAIPSSGETPIGGLGLMLHFNFHFAILMWIALATLGWIFVGFMSNWQLLTLGTIFVEDPVDMCRAVHWGAGMRALIRDQKLSYTVALYVASTLAVMIFAVRQNHRVAQVKNTAPMMADYVAVCTGFPQESGPSVDEEIADYIHQATGHQPEGVSVAWDFMEKRGQVYGLLTSDLREMEIQMEAEQGVTSSRPMSSRAVHNGFYTIAPRRRASARSAGYKQTAAIIHEGFDPILQRFFGFIEKLTLSQADSITQQSSDRDTLKTRSPVNQESGHRGFWARRMCEEMMSTGTAIVVFSTMRARDEAVASLNSAEALRYKMMAIGAKTKDWDADGILWENFAVTRKERIWRLIIGILASAIMLVLWGICFYAPWAYYEATTFAQMGRPPSYDREMILSLIVLCGNQLVYLLCSVIAEEMRYPYQDSTQNAYVFIYTAAIMLNTVFDVTVIAYTTYLAMVMRGVRTDDGTKLTELPDAAAVFKSYPMMKVFGRTLYEYNFPACFLYAFIGEALFTVLIPLHLGKTVVRTKENCSREQAEAYLRPLPMDLARYADLVVNCSLAALSIMTTSGWISRNLFGLLLGNIFIYAFDHYRILRHVEANTLTSPRIDTAACMALVVPCAVVGTCILVQLHEAGLLQRNLWLCLILGFLSHVTLHAIAVGVSLRCFGRRTHRENDTPYRELEAKVPGNWFNTNPIHCLRTQYMHDNGSIKPCVWYVKGKEAILQYHAKVASGHGHFASGGILAPQLKAGVLSVPGWDS